MDLTQGTQKEKNDRAKKMMLWFGIVGLIMAFAALTSAYIVSRSRKDWLKDVELPPSFYISTAVIVLSSITYILAKKAIKENYRKTCTTWLWVTLGLGVLFIGMQINGFSQMVAEGNYFTGPTSNIKASYIYVIAGAHIAHLIVGIITLGVVLYNQWKGKYTSTEFLGMSLGATFWHFLGIIWVYLLLFMQLVD